MGMRGPPPRPGEVLRLIGSSGERKRHGEVGIVDGRPEPPDWLSESGREQWNLMVARMEGLQMCSPGWRECLAQFCEAWSEWEALVLACRSEPFTVTSDNGVVRVNPMYTRKDAAFDRLLKLGREFGYSPASKTMVRMEKKAAVNDKSRFFRKG